MISLPPYKQEKIMVNKLLMGLGCSSLLLLSHTATAAVVDGYSSYEEMNFVQGTRFATETLEFSQSGRYDLVLTDFNFGSQFENLMVTITTGADSLLSEDGESFMIDYANPEQYEDGNGIFTDNWTFEADAGSYFLTLWADVEGSSIDNNIGFYGLKISGKEIYQPQANVPLPPALLFLGTALIPLAGFRRRRRD